MIINNKFPNQYFLFFTIVLQMCSCLTAGTHGSIKSYNFPVSKKTLQKVVEMVITESPDIRRDTGKNYIVDVTNGKNDTVINNQYNDGHAYLTIQIQNKVGGEYCEFTFQYVGNENDWDTAKTSTLSIAYAYDEKGNGGSNENGGASFTSELRKKLANLFESKFIERIKNKLGVK